MASGCEFQEERMSVVIAAQQMRASGLVTGTSGNVSRRIGSFIYITPSGIDYSELTPELIVPVHLDGRADSESQPRPSSETPLHLSIYRHFDVHAITHVHSTAATAVGLVLDELPAVHYCMRALGGSVRVADYATFGSQRLADNVTTAMEGRSGVIMRNHGTVCTGATPGEALEKCQKLEWASELYLRAAQLGVPAALSSGDLDEVAEMAQTTGYRI